MNAIDFRALIESDLRELRRRLASVVVLAEEIERRMAGLESGPDDCVDVPDGRIAERVVTLLEKHPDVAFGPARIAALLSTQGDSIRSVVSKLVAQGRVERHGYGRYSARSKGSR